ncbi:hypothetical protein FD755_014771 [Muntiacus reevesi]|uniref:Uncharacterized protein n=1 Tax=Muntiacus reevesi TaxID=9886 RepID=A0A5N3XHK4_MUNRE|nr:hypothetical protein FD755_014771 [Muntiacus reevesi]
MKSDCLPHITYKNRFNTDQRPKYELVNVLYSYSGIFISHKKELEHWHLLHEWMNLEDTMLTFSIFYPFYFCFLELSDSLYSCVLNGYSRLTARLGRFPGEENGNPLQYSCLESPMDRGAWRDTVYGVTRVGHELVTKPPPPPRLPSKPTNSIVLEE